MKIYLDFRDWWVGYYRGDHWHYACPLPCVVIRIPRRKKMSAYRTRVISRQQAQDWDLDYKAPGELDRQMIEERRWYSVWQVVFTAPDDGLVYSAEYRHPATEMQEGLDAWDGDEVTLTRCEPCERTVIVYNPVVVM